MWTYRGLLLHVAINSAPVLTSSVKHHTRIHSPYDRGRPQPALVALDDRERAKSIQLRLEARRGGRTVPGCERVASDEGTLLQVCHRSLADGELDATTPFFTASNNRLGGCISQGSRGT